jgi:adenylosuccinate synthase
MSVIAIIGAQWGDEGKGKIVELLAQDADMVIRFSGGDNAGHTVVNQLGEFKLHLIPSGIFSSRATCLIGNGVAINPSVFLEEIDQLNKLGVTTSKVFISDHAHLIMPYHLILDSLEEQRRGGKAIGTTRKGIGPAFTDKVARLGIRTGDLLDREIFVQRLRPILDYKNTILTQVYGEKPLSLSDIISSYSQYGERLATYIRDTSLMIDEALEKGDVILLEGAQGTLLDPDFGTYPYATSSSPLAGGACIGTGLGPTRINHSLGIFKAYCTRVGAGPMPTELKDETGNLIREQAHEYGATTGRPRRCGWFDAVAARYSSRINGFNGAVVTRLDILDIFPKIKIGTSYKLDEKVINHFPRNATTLAKCQPIYEELPGWQTPTSHITQYEELPKEAKQYISYLEKIINCPVKLISVGASREQTINKSPLI